MWSFMMFMRIVRGLLQQPWTMRVVGAVSLVSLIAGLIGWIVDWPYAFRFLFWGVIWAIVGLGAWAMNRGASA